jgi:aminocarboxymuconate-semialdehyde decarboxylase
MTIDVHAHALSERFLSDLSRKPIAGLSTAPDGKGGYAILRNGVPAGTLDPNLHDLPRRLESLKRRKISLQLIGPAPPLLSWVGGAANVELARALHEQSLETQAASEGIIEPMALPALAEPEKAAAEIERAVGDYGFRSVMLPSSAGDRPLDDPCFAELFATFERLGLLVFMHPTTGFPPDRFVFNGMNVLLSWPFETTLSVTRLIFSGVLHRHPGLKLVLAHGGGNLVFLRGRLNAAYEATGWEANPYYTKEIDRLPSDYLDRLYYDTCTLSPDSTTFLLNTMGADRVVFGSDYPFDVGDPEGERAQPAIDALPQETKEKVLVRTAASLLPGRNS